MTYMRTVGTVDFARKTCAYGYPSSLEVYWQDLGLAVEAAFRRNWVVGAPPVVRATASEWRVRAVMGYEGLREQRVISLAGLDDVQVETTKLHLLAGRPEWAGARVWLRAVSADRLLFRVDTLDVSQRAAADVPREWLSLPAPDHVLPGALDADPFVSFRKLWIRPKPVPPDLVRLDGRWEVYTTQVDQREPVIRF